MMKILIAEDDVVSGRRLEVNLLSWNYDVLVAHDGDEAWRLLQGEDAPRLAILDWMMPGMDGVKVCEEVRKLKGDPYVYILMLTARDRKEDVVTGLNAGADDYLTKPYHAHELKARLRAGRRILALQESLLSARDALRFQATLDPLTGLWNRAVILATLKRELIRAERQGAALAVFVSDLDHLSRINENYGYQVGDSVLRESAQRMRTVGRIYDSVGRLGGEEFIIISPGCDAPEAAKQAERLRTLLSDKPMDLPEGIVGVTLSVGVAAVPGDSTADPSTLLWAAEAALSRAKELGRNRVEVAPADGIYGWKREETRGRGLRQRLQFADRSVA